MYVILLLFVVPAVLGYKNGPPVQRAGLCTNMIPTGHNGGVSLANDTASPPYNITTSPANYTAGSTVTVTITGTGGNIFKGFFIQARRADPTMDNDVAIGDFSDPPATTQLLPCHNVANSAWGHSNSNERLNATATWNAPKRSEGPIQFRATIVKGVPTRAYFYLNVMSDEVAFMAGPQPPTGDTTAPPTTPSTASLTVPLAQTTLALSLAALLAAHRQ